MTTIVVESEIEIRSGAGYEVAEVNFPKRIVTVVAMPYEKPAMIHDPRKSFLEVVSRGAFDGIEKRASQIRANRDHTWDKLVGKIVGLHPSRSEGLVTEIRIFKTDIGERTLQECDEGGLDASAGFGLLRRDDGRVWDDAEVWERNRSVRRLNRLWLDHVAFVPNPAYQDAGVLSVRTGHQATREHPSGDDTVGATPNLDRLAYEALKAKAAEIDRRYLG